MRLKAATRSGFAVYLALYLCLLMPLHLWHTASHYVSTDQIAGACDEECHEVPHYGASCPVCQLGSGWIDLPIDVDLTPTSTLLTFISVPDATDPGSKEPVHRSPRSPPHTA